MRSINSISAIAQREFLITFRNFTEILSIFLFFLLGIMIFVFSIGENNEMFNEIGIGIIWTLLLLSNNLSLRKFYQDCYRSGYILGDEKLFHWLFKNNGGQVVVISIDGVIIAHQGYVPIVFTNGFLINIILQN